MIHTPNKRKSKAATFFGFRAVDAGFSAPAARRGFTLVETLVAIAVLLLAVAAPLTLGSQGLTSSRIARDQVVATYLMQDAIEYIHNRRDTNRLSGAGWLDGLEECMSDECRISTKADFENEDAVEACPQAGCPVLNFHTNAGFYSYDGGPGGNGTWVPTKFVRTVTVEETVPGIEARVDVTVSWIDGLASRAVSTTGYILNWQ